MKNIDPTIQDMRETLTGFDPFDREAAIYYFAADYHGGQWSNLYSALSTSPYKPGLTATGDDVREEEAYMMLVSTYA